MSHSGSNNERNLPVCINALIVYQILLDSQSKDYTNLSMFTINETNVQKNVQIVTCTIRMATVEISRNKLNFVGFEMIVADRTT